MKKFEDESLEKIESQLKVEMDSIELEPFCDTMNAIRPRLKNKQHLSAISNRIALRFIAIAGSLILIFSFGFFAWLVWPKNTDTSYRYEDLDIETVPCEKSDLINYPDLYLPNFDIYVDIIFLAGKHIESGEIVYFRIDGTSINAGIVRQTVLTIIVKEEYSMPKEEKYNSGNTITVSKIDVSYIEEAPISPFICYSIGFKMDAVRYYIDYQTTSPENDIEAFMQLFLI